MRKRRVPKPKPSVLGRFHLEWLGGRRNKVGRPLEYVSFSRNRMNERVQLQNFSGVGIEPEIEEPFRLFVLSDDRHSIRILQGGLRSDLAIGQEKQVYLPRFDFLGETYV